MSASNLFDSMVVSVDSSENVPEHKINTELPEACCANCGCHLFKHIFATYFIQCSCEGCSMFLPVELFESQFFHNIPNIYNNIQNSS